MDPGEEEQENEEEMDFSQGVLSHLEWLERRERGRAVLREQRERRRERSEMLRAKIRELRQRRDGLRERLQILAQDKSGIPWHPREVLQWRLRRLRELLELFPLTGVSGHLSGHGLALALHASCRGALLPPAPLELRRRRRELRVRRHGLPAWAPAPAPGRELQPGGLRGLLGGLWGLLSARAARREQLRVIQEEFPDCVRGVPGSNSLCNVLGLRCRLPAAPAPIPRGIPAIPGENSQNSQISGNVLEFRARLRYGDPLRSLPTDVQISVEGVPAPPPPLALLLRSRPLPAALRQIRHWAAGEFGNSQKIQELPTGMSGNSQKILELPAGTA